MGTGGAFLSASKDGVTLRILAAPKASRNHIGTVQAEADGSAALKVSVTAAPEGGRANAAIVKLLAKSWSLPKSSISVKSGASSRRKTLFVEGDAEQLARLIKEQVEINND